MKFLRLCPPATLVVRRILCLLGLSFLLAASALQAQSEISVRFGDEESVTDGVTIVNFGTIWTNGGSAVQTFTVSNPGTAALTLGTVTLGGVHPGEFAILTQPAASVPAGGSTTFRIRFAPTHGGTVVPSGNRSATVSFSTNVTGKNPFNFSLTGFAIYNQTASGAWAPNVERTISTHRPSASTEGYVQVNQVPDAPGALYTPQGALVSVRSYGSADGFKFKASANGQYTFVISFYAQPEDEASSPIATYTYGVTVGPQVTLTSASPADNATAVSVGTNLVLTFSEEVQAGTGNIILRPTGGGADISIPVTGSRVTFNEAIVTINPPNDLAVGTTYDVILGSGVITSLTATSFVGLTTGQLNFTTVSTSTPVRSQDGLGSGVVVAANPLGTAVKMTGYNGWPFTKSTSSSYYGGAFDGQYIWLAPSGGQKIVRFHPVDGTMTRYNAPSETSYSGAVFDGSSIWLVPAEAPVTKVTADGTVTTFPGMPTGFEGGDGASFVGGVFDGTSVWLVPAESNMVVKINPATGAKTGYTSWPAGFTKGSDGFQGGVFDGQSIWLVPYSADRLVKVDKDSGAMTGYNAWPSGFSKSSSAFAGGVFDGQSIWLIPFNADRVIKVDKDTGAMTGYNAWPAGFNKGTLAFSGGAFDGRYLWLTPRSADRVVRVDTTNGTMTGHNNWPAGFTKGTSVFQGGVFDGTDVWLIPGSADRLVKISTDGTSAPPGDTTAPTIVSVTPPSSATYKAGANLDFTVTFSESVTIDTNFGTPQLSLTIGTTPRAASYVAGGAGTTHTFRYAVAAGDSDDDAIHLAGTLSLNGGSIKDAANIVLSPLTFTVPSTTGVKVDGVAPRIASISRKTPTTESTLLTTVKWLVVFSEPVSGLAAEDFATSGTPTGALSVSAASGETVDVTLAGITGTGSVGLGLASGFSIADAAGNALTNTTVQGTNQNTFTITSSDVPPTISVHPQSKTVAGTQSTSLTVTAAGTAPLAYQWFKDDVALDGQIFPTLTLPYVLLKDAGAYKVKVTNSAGHATSNPATLTVAPYILNSSTDRSVGLGGRHRFFVAAEGSGTLAYQWYRGDVALSGATNAEYQIDAVTLADAGSYRVKVTGAGTPVESTPAVLTILPNPIVYRVTTAISGAAGVTGFFTIEGTQPKKLIVAAHGPALTSTTGAIADPQIVVEDATGQSVVTNNDWGSLEDTTFGATYARLGLAPLASGSKDAVVYRSFNAGSYRVRITGVGGATGAVGLVIADADLNPPRASPTWRYAVPFPAARRSRAASPS